MFVDWLRMRLWADSRQHPLQMFGGAKTNIALQHDHCLSAEQQAAGNTFGGKILHKSSIHNIAQGVGDHR
jgi:hypothetical protein